MNSPEDVETAVRELARRGALVLRGTVTGADLAALTLAARHHRETVPIGAGKDGKPVVLADGTRWLSTASSRQLDEPLLRAALEASSGSMAHAVARAHLGDPPGCNADEAWLRHQPPPRSAPAGHHPHAWHQDGALRANFAAPDSLLPMLTCWIPLDPCGVHAPALELVEQRPDRLLMPREVMDWAVGRPTRVPQLAGGDALLFDSSVVHRTHVHPSMTAARISIELRLLPPDRITPRLAGDRFVAWRSASQP